MKKVIGQIVIGHWEEKKEGKSFGIGHWEEKKEENHWSFVNGRERESLGRNRKNYNQ